MHDILIVTSRNVATSGGEFSLIKNRADALKNGWGIESDVAALCNVRLGVSEGGEAFGPGVYVRRDFMNPMQLLSGYEELITTAEKKVLSGSYKAIILSGVGLFRYVDRMKRAAEASGAFVCADVHGYYGDGSLLARDEPLFLGSFHRAAAFVERYEQRKYLRKFDRIFCVSRAYRSFLCRECGCKEGQFYIVPCATGAKPSFGRAEELKYREDYRRKYGVEDNEWLLVYSGGASSWQCLPQTAELYREILKRRGAKLLVLSGDVTSARAAIGDCDDVEFDSFKPSDLPSVFCAADFFVMLREDVPTNHFAYPNKFLEYVAAHRPVITTPYVYDIAEEIDRHGVGLLYNGDVDDLVLKMDNAVCDRDSCDRLVQKVSLQIPSSRLPGIWEALGPVAKVSGSSMLITVFTPTYNRAYILPKLFESLKRQSFRDFEWIIVDDGSTDDTRKLVEAMQQDCQVKFPIRYFFQVNSGKHVAWNKGLDEAKGALFFPVDSDDYLTDDALERIGENCETVMSNERLIALSGVRIFPGNKLTGGILQDNVGSYIDYSSIDRRSKGITGDLAEAFVTERLRKYRFPVFEDERFVPEAVVFNRFSNDGYLIRGYAFPLYVCEYLADGYTKNTDRLLITNWKGYRLYVSELMHSTVGIRAKAIPFCGFMYRSLLKMFGLCK